MKNWTYKNWTIHHFEKLASTNVLAFEKAESQQIFDHEIIMADEQIAGKGRMDRVWSSPQGNLYFSLILQPRVSPNIVAQISFVAIVALRQAIEELAPDNLKQKLNIQNKWPNDLLINGKKIAGLLLESKNNQQNCEFIIVGIGVNIASSPSVTIFPAANLADFGLMVLPQILLQKFLDKFEILYKNWLDFGFKNIRKALILKAYRLKENISIVNEGKKIDGVFEDIDGEGCLVLRLTDGVLRVSVADVFG